MSANVCLSFSYDACSLSRENSDPVPEFIRYKHREAMKRAHEILCPDLSRRSAVQEALDSVHSTPWLHVE